MATSRSPLEESETPIVHLITRSERQKCHLARDAFFNCMDKNSIKKFEQQPVCIDLYKEMTSLCPDSWSQYFIAKREREIQFEDMKRIGIQKSREEEELKEKEARKRAFERLTRVN
ncbi:hypothetical protein V1511DRAFT_462607 [Dipodascopsis uninucleata]